MNPFHPSMQGRVATLLAALTAITLAACGGGGSGAEPPVQVMPPVTVAMQPAKAVVTTSLCNSAPASHTTSGNGLCLVTDASPVRAAAKAAPRAAAAVAALITPDELFTWAQATFPTLFPEPSATITATGYVYRYYPSTNSYTAVAADGGVYVLFVNGDGLVKYVAPIADFVCLVKPALAACVLAAWWPPTSVAAIDAKTSGPKALPIDGQLNPTIGGNIWQQATKVGTIKYADTGMILTGFSSRPMFLAYFIEPLGKNVCTTLVYKDDGSSIYPNPLTYGGCKTDAFDWIVGTADGFIAHFPTIGKCQKESWNVSSQRFDATEVICP